MARGDLPRLITIPISHYCEKARWALDRAAIDYREEAHLQLIHWFFVRRAGGGRTAPVLVCDDGVLSQSAAIVEWADGRIEAERRLIPWDDAERAEALGLERHFDDELGPHSRRWTYFRVLTQPELFDEYNATGVPAWERRSFPLFMPIALRALSRYLEVTPTKAADSQRRVRRVFDEVAERLSDGRRYICGERFTVADLAFAALSAAVIVPENYGVPLPQPDVLTEPFASEVHEMRAHPAGQFALRIYAEERAGSGRAPVAERVL
jgi:glutathione S-transferase